MLKGQKSFWCIKIILVVLQTGLKHQMDVVDEFRQVDPLKAYAIIICTSVID